MSLVTLKQRVCIQRPPQEGQSFPEGISGCPTLHCFQFPSNGSHYLISTIVSLCLWCQKLLECFSLLSQGRFICATREVSSAPGAWAKGRTNCLKSLLSGCSRRQPKTARCGSECCWHLCFVSFYSLSTVLKLHENQS